MQTTAPAHVCLLRAFQMERITHGVALCDCPHLSQSSKDSPMLFHRVTGHSFSHMDGTLLILSPCQLTDGGAYSAMVVNAPGAT